MPKDRVIVLGCFIKPRAGWETVAIRDADSFPLQPDAPALILVGDDALVCCDPAALFQRLGSNVIVMLVQDVVDAWGLKRWKALGFDDITRPDALDDAVARRLHGGLCVRRAFQPADWVQPVPEVGTAACTALEVLTELRPAYAVGAWARALAWDRRQLWQICKEDLGARPTEVLFLHVIAQVKQARARGFSVETVARNLGYAHATSLCHAFKRRGMRVPRRVKRR